MSDLKTVENIVENVLEHEATNTANAEYIAAAAIEGARGEKITLLEKEIAECRSTMNLLPEMLAAKLSDQLALLKMELQTEMAQLKASLPSVAVAVPENPILTAPLPSTLPALEVTTPETVPMPEAENEVVEKTRIVKKNRLV